MVQVVATARAFVVPWVRTRPRRTESFPQIASALLPAVCAPLEGTLLLLQVRPQIARFVLLAAFHPLALQCAASWANGRVAPPCIVMHALLGPTVPHKAPPPFYLAFHVPQAPGVRVRDSPPPPFVPNVPQVTFVPPTLLFPKSVLQTHLIAATAALARLIVHPAATALLVALDLPHAYPLGSRPVAAGPLSIPPLGLFLARPVLRVPLVQSPPPRVPRAPRGATLPVALLLATLAQRVAGAVVVSPQSALQELLVLLQGVLLFPFVSHAPPGLTTQALGLAPVPLAFHVGQGLIRQTMGPEDVASAHQAQLLVYLGPPISQFAPNVTLAPSPPSLDSFFVVLTAPREPWV